MPDQSLLKSKKEQVHEVARDRAMSSCRDWWRRSAASEREARAAAVGGSGGARSSSKRTCDIRARRIRRHAPGRPYRAPPARRLRARPRFARMGHSRRKFAAGWNCISARAASVARASQLHDDQASGVRQPDRLASRRALLGVRAGRSGVGVDGAGHRDGGERRAVVRAASRTTLPFTSDRFDEAKFFRSDLPENEALIRTRCVAGTEGGRRRVLPLQHAALGRQESHRPGEILAGLHLSRREQRAVAGDAFGFETGSRRWSDGACGACPESSVRSDRRACDTPPAISQIVLLVGEPVKKRETSLLSE